MRDGKEQSINVKSIKIPILILSVVFLILGILPMVTSILKISCIAFSILLFLIFLILFFGKEKEMPKEEIRQEMEIDVGETIFF